jgi:hypothetical protein
VGRLDHYLVTRNYGGHSPDEAGQRLSNLESVHGTLAVLRNVAGQSWYLLVASLGIGLWAALAIDRQSLRRLTRTGLSTPKLVLGMLVVALAGLVALSALSFGDVERADMLIYGRYTEVLIPPLLAIALTQLPSLGKPRMSLALGVIGAVTLLVAVLRHTVHPIRSPNRWNVGSLPFLTSSLGLASVLGAGIVAAAALVAFVALSRRYPAALAPAVLLLFIPTTAYIERDPVLAGEHYVYGAGWVSPGSVDTHGHAVAYDSDQPTGLYVNQWFMPTARFVLFSGSTETPPAPYVISSQAWARAHPALQPRALWSDRHHDRTLFAVANR